jgi:hypothetical protein
MVSFLPRSTVVGSAGWGKEGTMVRVIRQEQSEDEHLDGLIAQLAQKHGLKLDRTGWSRKTYDLFLHDRAADRSLLVARVETLATVNGEVRVFDDRGLPFARELAEELERTFGLKEATILCLPPPA